MRSRFSLFLFFCSFLLTASAQVQFFPPLQQAPLVIEGSPEGRVSMDIGILIVDRITGKYYSKTTTRAINTGWVEVGAGGGGTGTVLAFTSQFTVTGDTNIAIASGASITNAALVTPSLGVATATSIAVGPTNVVTALSTKAELTSPSFTTPSLGSATALTLDTGQGANELYDMDQNVMTTSSPTFPGITLSPNGKLDIVWTNLATTPLAGLSLSNATPATAGVTVQDSPALVWSGHSWLTGSLSNATATFRSYVLPAQGGTVQTAIWKLDSSVNSGAFVNALSITDLGLTTTPSLTVSGVSTAARFALTALGSIESPVNGEIILKNTARNAIATLQANTPQITKTANYTIAAALDSGLRFNNIGSVIATTNTLPTAVAAQHYWHFVDAAQILSIKAAGSDVIQWGSNISPAAGDIWSSVVGSAVHLYSPKAGLWVVDSDVGTWNMASNAGIGSTIRKDNLTTLPIDGLFLTNATPATAGVTVQDSPAIYQSGGAWLTGSLSNAPVTFRSYVVPVAGATAPTGTLKIDSSLNGAAFGAAVTIDGLAGLSAVNLTAAGVVSGVVLAIPTKMQLKATADGVVEVNNIASTARATVQANIPQITKTANYTIVALDSGLQFDNIGASVTNRLDLPTAVAKMRYMGYVDAAFRMQFQAVGSDVIRDGASVSGAAAGIYASAVGSCIELFCPKAGLWVVRSKNGTWTIE